MIYNNWALNRYSRGAGNVMLSLSAEVDSAVSKNPYKVSIAKNAEQYSFLISTLCFIVFVLFYIFADPFMVTEPKKIPSTMMAMTIVESPVPKVSAPTPASSTQSNKLEDKHETQSPKTVEPLVDVAIKTPTEEIEDAAKPDDQNKIPENIESQIAQNEQPPVQELVLPPAQKVTPILSQVKKRTRPTATRKVVVRNKAPFPSAQLPGEQDSLEIAKSMRTKSAARQISEVESLQPVSRGVLNNSDTSEVGLMAPVRRVRRPASTGRKAVDLSRGGIEVSDSKIDSGGGLKVISKARASKSVAGRSITLPKGESAAPPSLGKAISGGSLAEAPLRSSKKSPSKYRIADRDDLEGPIGADLSKSLVNLGGSLTTKKTKDAEISFRELPICSNRNEADDLMSRIVSILIDNPDIEGCEFSSHKFSFEGKTNKFSLSIKHPSSEKKYYENRCVFLENALKCLEKKTRGE